MESLFERYCAISEVLLDDGVKDLLWKKKPTMALKLHTAAMEWIRELFNMQELLQNITLFDKAKALCELLVDEEVGELLLKKQPAMAKKLLIATLLWAEESDYTVDLLCKIIGSNSKTYEEEELAKSRTDLLEVTLMTKELQIGISRLESLLSDKEQQLACVELLAEAQKNLENASLTLKRILDDKNRPCTTSPGVNRQNGADLVSHAVKTAQLNIEKVADMPPALNEFCDIDEHFDVHVHVGSSNAPWDQTD